MWVIFSLSSALTGSVRGIFTRYSVLRINEYVALWASTLFCFLMSCFFVIWLGFNIQSFGFWKFILIRVAIDTLGFITFFKALKCRGVSYVIPLTSISALLTVGPSILINHQIPSELGLTGIIILSLANLLLVASEVDFRGTRNNKELIKATFLVIATVIIWAVADPLNSEAVRRSNPQTYLFISYFLFSVIFTLIVLIKERLGLKKLFSDKSLFAVNISSGLILAVERILFLTALAGAFTAYVAALSRLRIILSVILAYLFLREKINLAKLVGILLASIGAVFIALA